MNEITITTGQFEDLIRDSEKVRILEELSRQRESIHTDLMAAVIGFRAGVPVETAPPAAIVNTTMEELVEAVSVPADGMLVSADPPPHTEPEKTSKKKIDRGKVLALHKAGWSNKAIAEEMSCSTWSVCMILKEEK